MRKLVQKHVDIRAVAGLLVAMFMGVAGAFSLPAFAANTFPNPRQYDLVSINNVDSKGVNKHASMAGISRDGSKVLYSTAATNLPDSGVVANATGGYLRDMTAGTTVRVDKSQNGTPADGTSDRFVLSETGRYVAFRSKATNLIDGTMYSATYRIYIKDLQTGAVQVTNPTVDSSDANYAYSFPTAISNDGRFVTAYTKVSNHFITGIRTTTGKYDIIRFDRMDGSWQLINKPNDGVLQNVNAIPRSTDCAGELTLFQTDATNMVSNFSGAGSHLYLADTRNGVVITDILPGIAGSTDAKISCSGRYILYTTTDRTLIIPTPTGMSSNAQVVRFDRITGERIYIGSNSSNNSFNATGPAAVTDRGDAIVLYPSGIMNVYNLPEYVYRFKHLSDGSGTLEEIQGNGGLASDSLTSITISADGNYVAASTPDAYALGLPVDYESGIDSNHTWNVIRVKTGL